MTERAALVFERMFARWPLALALALLFFTSPAQAQSPEYRIKAVFLFNFAQFVEWPAEAFPDEKAPLVIGILGQDPFGGFLDELVHDELAHNRPVQIQRFRRTEDLKNCHVLFVSQSETDRFETVLQEMKGRPILTVSDIDKFASRGGMVRFITEKNKIRFRINLEVAQAARLNISSKLLRAAEITSTQKER